MKGMAKMGAKHNAARKTAVKGVKEVKLRELWE
jgi:hypothetical protein